MLFKTFIAIRDMVDYTRNDDGSWRGEFHGAFDVAAEGPTLEECRIRVQDAVDAWLVAWVTASAAVAHKERPQPV